MKKLILIAVFLFISIKPTFTQEAHIYVIELDTILNLDNYMSTDKFIIIEEIVNNSGENLVFLKNLAETIKPIKMRKMIRNLSSDVTHLKTVRGIDFDITRFQKKYVVTTLETLEPSTLANLVKNNLHINAIYEAHSFQKTDWPPNDTFWEDQIQLYSAPYNINLQQAWNYTDGNSGIKVGIFDDALDYTHPDFGNGIGQGFRVRGGYDFFQGDSDPKPEGTIDSHGTKVAGLIGALNNNSTGVIGISGGWETAISGCQLFAFKLAGFVQNHYFDINIPFATEAIIEAASDPSINNGFGYGIHIMNFSFGKDENELPFFGTEQLDLYYACVFSYFNNVLMAAARGNNIPGSTISLYPANYSNGNVLLSVAGVQNNGIIHQNSNYGDGVSISAHYESAKTTTIKTIGNGYDTFNGTSNATPYVTGTAALIYSKFLERGITVLNDDAMKIIKLSAEETGDPFHYGAGRLKTGEALRLCGDAYNLEHLTANINKSVTNVSNPSGGILSLYYPFNSYVVSETKRVRATVHIPEGYDLSETWTWANSYSEGYEWGNPSYGMPRATFVSQNGRDVTYEMFLYRMMPIGGSTLYWYPTDPYSADINVSILGKYTPIVPPIFDPDNPFTQNPDPICIGSHGNVAVNLSQGSNGATYVWDDEGSLDYFGASFVSHGSYCTVYFPNTEGYSNPMVPQAYLKCTVTNSAGTIVATHFINKSDNCSSCPTLSFKVNGEMIDENPLLITSLSNPGTDVTDYYLIQNPITPDGDEIDIRIHEPQTEHTWLDYVELIEAKVKSDELVAVNDEGEVINYKMGLPPVTVMLNGETDITEILAELDTLEISLSVGDVLTISREELSPGGSGDMVLGGEVPPPAKDQESFTVSLIREKDIDQGIENNEEDNPPPLGGLFFRQNKSIIARSLRNLPPGNLEITINKELVLDYLALVKNIKTAKVKTLDLLNAEHDQRGDVKGLLSGADQNYAEIYPGESIDFIFESGPGSPDKKAYILKSVGRYETDSSFIIQKGSNLTGTGNEIIIPLENKLFDNYPNPFNPVTQIQYSIKEDSPVSLKVYDILGNEVVVLVKKEQPAGNYTVEFDASNLSSGIYFYSITAEGFYHVKKMILIK